MNSYYVYRISFYLMMSAATTALCLDTSETSFGSYYPLIVSICGGLAFFLIDLNTRREVPRWTINLLGLSTFILPYFEFTIDESQVARPIGHWLILLQLVMYLLPKTPREDWFLFGLGLLEVLIGSMINESDQVGLWLFVWATLAIWVLSLFFLQREAQRFFKPVGELAAGSPGPGASKFPVSGIDPYPSLINIPFVFASVRILLGALLLGGLIFMFMPRQAGAARNRGGPTPTRHLTGFGDEVQLGQLGEILEDDSVVMNVEFFDENEQRTQPDVEPLWRGSTMAQYESWKWHRQRQQPASLPVYRKRGNEQRRVLRQNIHLEANDSQSLFGIRPMIEVSATVTRFSPFINMIDGTISRPEVRSGSYEAYDYRVISDADRLIAGTEMETPQRSEEPPGLIRLELLRDIPDDLGAKFRQIAAPIVAGVSAKGEQGTIEKARKLEAYLRDSGEFGYTLQMDSSNPALDPVEDFLVNRKEGHCEYFASALALLLRSIDVPSRLVNGFKGGDWNDVTQAMYVRKKHAHSWVEAYIGSPDGRSAIWITLDPTPSLERQKSVAEVGGFTSNFRTISDTIRHVWVFYVLGFDADRQNRLVYEPIRKLADEVKEGYILLDDAIRSYLGQLVRFEGPGSLSSIRGLIVWLIRLATLSLVLFAIYWIARRLLRLFRGSEDDSTSAVAGILFYRRLAQTLGKFEVERESSQTQREFAAKAAMFLAARGPGTETVADVPGLVVDAFYRVRFGHLNLPEETLKHIEERLDALDESLKPE